MKSFRAALLLSILIQFAQPQYYDEEFWEAFDEEEKPYEHPWYNMPDVIDRPQVEWYFNMTHHFLTGIERGMYMNDSIVLHEDCFGKRYLNKTNWMVGMFQHDPWEHWIQIGALSYQFYYMWSDKCKIDETFKDFYLYCWNEGCYGDEVMSNTQLNFLYMTRALLDALIVWYEGVPEEKFVEPEQWHALSR